MIIFHQGWAWVRSGWLQYGSIDCKHIQVKQFFICLTAISEYFVIVICNLWYVLFVKTCYFKLKNKLKKLKKFAFTSCKIMLWNSNVWVGRLNWSISEKDHHSWHSLFSINVFISQFSSKWPSSSSCNVTNLLSCCMLLFNIHVLLLLTIPCYKLT